VKTAKRLAQILGRVIRYDGCTNEDQVAADLGLKSVKLQIKRLSVLGLVETGRDGALWTTEETARLVNWRFSPHDIVEASEIRDAR
jgi:Mn-dependent DtxR family transcriptional regulator